jgi:hypothetical protein
VFPCLSFVSRSARDSLRIRSTSANLPCIAAEHRCVMSPIAMIEKLHSTTHVRGSLQE